MASADLYTGFKSRFGKPDFNRGYVASVRDQTYKRVAKEHYSRFGLKGEYEPGKTEYDPDLGSAVLIPHYRGEDGQPKKFNKPLMMNIGGTDHMIDPDKGITILQNEPFMERASMAAQRRKRILDSVNLALVTGDDSLRALNYSVWEEANRGDFLPSRIQSFPEMSLVFSEKLYQLQKSFEKHLSESTFEDGEIPQVSWQTLATNKISKIRATVDEKPRPATSSMPVAKSSTE